MQAAFLRCLEECDVDGINKLWAHVAPHLPRQTPERTLVAIHHARTQSQTVRFRSRAYSHRWLTDNGYPSGLPDWLKPKAERIYPKIVGAVGVACLSKSELYKPITALVQTAMSDAVSECYADGHEEPGIVKPRMMEVRKKTVRKLLGKGTI